MIKIHNNLYCHTFEYLYLFVMVIYMAQMTPVTGKMVGTLSGDPIPFLIPIVLTIILLIRNPISFLHSKLWLFVGVMLIWSVAVCYKFLDFSSNNLSYYFFLFYAIIIAFIHVRVYGCELFDIYEHIMVVLAAISLVFWSMSILIPSLNDLFQQFPETSQGHNILYLFNCYNYDTTGMYSINRNAGCSWEPGRFAIMLIPAIYNNLSREGVSFQGNKKIIILLLALVSTFSTTGYSIAILLYFIFWFDRVNAKTILTFLLIALPLSTYIYSLDFVEGKIRDKANFEGLTHKRMERFDYHAREDGDEYVGSLDRFESAYFEWTNFQNEPLLGYGRNVDYSWFRQKITENYVLTGGLVKILSQYGIFVGLLLYVILFFSSYRMSQTCQHRKRFTFAIMIMLTSISYPIFCIPVFTAFWLYGLFCYKEDEIEGEDEEYLESDEAYETE